jgi:hypothetical protein
MRGGAICREGPEAATADFVIRPLQQKGLRIALVHRDRIILEVTGAARSINSLAPRDGRRVILEDQLCEDRR